MFIEVLDEIFDCACRVVQDFSKMSKIMFQSVQPHITENYILQK